LSSIPLLQLNSKYKYEEHNSNLSSFIKSDKSFYSPFENSKNNLNCGRNLIYKFDECHTKKTNVDDIECTFRPKVNPVKSKSKDEIKSK